MKNYIKLFEPFYLQTFHDSRHSRLILSHLRELKYPLDDVECKVVNYLSKDADELECREFFQAIKEFERQKFESFLQIDYLFFHDMPTTNIKEATRHIKKYIDEFDIKCKTIIAHNRFKLNHACWLYEQREVEMALEGGLCIQSTSHLRKNKDIDFVYFDEKLPNHIQYDTKLDDGSFVTVDMFKNSYFLSQKPTPTLEDTYFDKELSLRLFTREFIKKRIQNTILPLKRGIIFDYESCGGASHTLCELFYGIKKRYGFYTYPLSICSDELLSFYIKRGTKELEYIKALKYSTIYLLIFATLVNDETTLIVYEFFTKRAYKIYSRFDNINFVFITLLIFLPFLKEELCLKSPTNPFEIQKLLEDLLKHYLKFKMGYINALKL